MAVRPDDRMVTVELLDDVEGAAEGADRPRRGRVGADGASAATDADAPERARRLGLQGLLALLAAMATLAAVAAVLLTTQDDRLPVVEGPGLVVALDSPLAARWQTTTGTVLGTADSTVVLAREGLGEREVIGLDERTGEVLWSQPYGATATVSRCTESVSSDPPAAWCWRFPPTGPDSGERDREATLLQVNLHDGAIVSEQPIVVPSGGFAMYDDDLLLAERNDDVFTVRRVDPLTQAPVWTTDVQLLPRSYVGSFAARMRLEEHFVVVDGPTTVIIDADDGTVLTFFEPVDDRRLTGLNAADVVTTPYGFAAWYRMVDGYRSRVGTWYDATGHPAVDFEGELAEPTITDGSEPDVVLVRRGGDLVAVEAPSGAELWSLDLTGIVVLQRHDGAVLVAGQDRLTLFQLRTGELRWSMPVEGINPDSGALSDGSVVVVLAARQGGWMMEALSLSRGERLWFAAAPGTPDLSDRTAGGDPSLEVVGDQPVLRSGRLLTWLG